MPPGASKLIPDNPVIVEEVRLEGFDVLPADVRDELRDDLPIRAGVALTSEVEKAAGERAVETLQNHGYPYAQVALAREPIDAARTRVTLRADPGTLGFFGPINIAGNRRVDDRVIRRRLAYAPGDLFRRSAIEQTQQRIGALGLFKSVEIRAHDIDARPAAVPTLITVEERTPWHWNVGAGYAAGERLAVDARISHLNVFGSAERFDLQGRLSRIERTAEAAFTQSDTWHPALSLSLQARHQEIDEQAFFVLSRGGQAAAAWQWTPDSSSTVSYAVSREGSDVDPALGPLLGLQDGMLSAWSLDVDHRRGGVGQLRRAACRCTSSRPADGCPARSTTSASSARRGTIGAPSTTAWCLRAACGWVDRSERRRSGHSVAQEIFSGRIERDARMGYLRAESAVCLRRAGRREEPAHGDRRSAIADLQAPARRGLRRGRQRVAGSVDDASRRSPLRRRRRACDSIRRSG